MIPTSFQYHRANSIQDALSMLASGGEDAKLIAGGHSLLPVMKLRMSSPSHIIDISRVSDLREISEDGNSIVIGSAVTHGEIESSDLIQSKLPVMSAAASLIGDPQVRNKGTIGGSIAHADPAADWPGILLALDATVNVASSEGMRSIPITEFFKGLFYTALAENEIIVSVSIPTPGDHVSVAYQKFSQPASRYAVVGCAAYIEKEGDNCKTIRLGVNGVSSHAYRDTAVENALVGQVLNADTIKSASQQAAGGDTHVLSDQFASENYRQHLAKVYAERAILAAI